MSERTRRLTIAFRIFYGLGKIGLNNVWDCRTISNNVRNVERRAAWEAKFAPIRAEREAKASEDFFGHKWAIFKYAYDTVENRIARHVANETIMLDAPDYDPGPLV